MNIRQTIKKNTTYRMTTDSIDNVRMTRQNCRRHLKEIILLEIKIKF